MPNTLKNLRVKIFADSANLGDITHLAKESHISGFTTNPTLMHKAGVTEYESFARMAALAASDKPISFEVFSDDFLEMYRQAWKISQWGPNVYVKIPITDTQGKSSTDLIKRLTEAEIKVNVTAILTLAQVKVAAAALSKTPAIISVFAGRIADAGVDPVPLIREAKMILADNPDHQLLWASCREVYNIFQADETDADIITVTPEILGKLRMIGTDLNELSRQTVQMFFDDGRRAGYHL
jgi:transaldolase